MIYANVIASFQLFFFPDSSDLKGRDKEGGEEISCLHRANKTKRQSIVAKHAIL